MLSMMTLSTVKRFTSIIRTAGCSLITVRTCKLAGITHGIYPISSLGISTVDLYILSCQSLGSIISPIGLGLSKCVHTRTRWLSNGACEPLGTGLHVGFTHGRQLESVLFQPALIILVRCDHFKLGPVYVQRRQVAKFGLQGVWARLLHPRARAKKRSHVGRMLRMR